MKTRLITKGLKILSNTFEGESAYNFLTCAEVEVVFFYKTGNDLFEINNSSNDNLKTFKIKSNAFNSMSSIPSKRNENGRKIPQSLKMTSHCQYCHFKSEK